MDTLSLSIAGRQLQISGNPESDIIMSLPGFPVFVSHSSASEPWKLSFGADLIWDQQTLLLTEFPFDEGDVICRLGRTKTSIVFSMTSAAGEQLLMEFIEGSDTVRATHSSSPDILRFGCWMAFAWLAGPHKIAPIHSSTIVHDGKAVLFLGESGTGKSTHTRLWLEHIPDSRLLNDDSPILSVEKGIPMVYGSPWSGKTHCYHPECFPLAAVVRLSQAPSNQMRHLSIIESFGALQPSLPPALAHIESYSDHIIAMISEVLGKVPVYHLACLPDADAALLSSSTIFSNN